MMTQSSVAYRANQAYRGAAITVPPLKAVIMLLNGAITFLQRSSQAQQAKRFEEGYEHLTRATAILRGLSHHLDELSARHRKPFGIERGLGVRRRGFRQERQGRFQRIAGALSCEYRPANRCVVRHCGAATGQK